MKNKISSFNFTQLKNKNSFDSIINAFNNDGVILIKNVLQPDVCDEYIKILNNVYNKTSILQIKNNKSFSGNFSAKYVSNLHNKNTKFLKFLDYNFIYSLILSLLQQGSYNNSG